MTLLAHIPPQRLVKEVAHGEQDVAADAAVAGAFEAAAVNVDTSLPSYLRPCGEYPQLR
jgi:hypothetical protein